MLSLSLFILHHRTSSFAAVKSLRLLEVTTQQYCNKLLAQQIFVIHFLMTMDWKKTKIIYTFAPGLPIRNHNNTNTSDSFLAFIQTVSAQIEETVKTVVCVCNR